MKRLLAIVIAVSVLTTSIGGFISASVVKSSIDAGSRRQAVRLFVAQVSACHRQNTRQKVANRNALAEWRFNSLFAAALAHPLPGRPPQSTAEKALTVRFLHRLQDTVASLAWTPPNNDCAHAPTSVQLPVAFSKRRPPRSALPG